MKLYMFRTVPLSIIRRFSLHTQQWYMSYRFAADSCPAGSGRNFLILLIYIYIYVCVCVCVCVCMCMYVCMYNTKHALSMPDD